MFERHRLWPTSDPHVEGQKQIGEHRIHFQACGRTTGKPVVFLHGGPGRGIQNSTWSFFNPSVWRIILVDQRGCGRSQPTGSLVNNTTADLVDDLEVLREHLGIAAWTVFGSGWGAFLGLAYAIKYPSRVTELVVNDVLLFRQKEIDWLFKYGASEHFPEAWEKFLAPLPETERSSPLKAYYRIFTSGSQSAQASAVAGWSIWESTTSGSPDMSAVEGGYDAAMTLARIECHYFAHRAFLTEESDILHNIDVLRQHRIAGIIVHGECDMVNPIAHARDLHLAWPEAEFIAVPGAGHSTREPGIRSALLAATKKIGGCGCLIQIKWLGSTP
jgi:proline iminopeptidase